MANDPNANEDFTYLLDAKSTRQFAFKTVNGEAVPPVRAFGGDELKVGETAYAFADMPIIDEAKRTVSTDVYKFTAEGKDAAGVMHGDAYSFHAVYNISPYRDSAGAPHIALDLTAASKADAEKMGFGRDFPTHFDKVESPSSGKLSVSLPPQHPGSIAAKARAAIKAEYDKKGAKVPYNQSAKKNYKYTDAQVEQALAKFSKDLTDEARAGRLDPVIGRNNETDQALKVLTRRKQGSLCFTGDAGVGKSAMFAAVAQRLVDDEANMPSSLKGARVMMLDLQAMNAGSRYRGDFEEKIKPVIDGLSEREGVLGGKKIIIAIDEIHSQLKSGGSEGSSDAGNMMKPFLTNKGVSVMGTTTDDEYRKFIESDGALASRFEKLRIESTDEDSTMKILQTLWPLTKEHNSLEDDLSEADLRYIITMTNRYAPQESQPRKSEKVMNMAAASAEFEHRSAINHDDIIGAVSQMSHLSADFLAQNDADRFLKMEEELPKEVLGQPGVAKVVDGLIGARGGLNDPNQPWGCFVFQGPTGTGKTELCKALARYLFGTEEAMTKLDMGSYMEKHEVSRLMGAPPGYVGYDDAPALSESVRKRPYQIILFDEIEKAHPDIFNVLLPILNDGKTTDNHGKTVLFNNCIIVMTTNAGALDAQKLLEGNQGMNFGGSKETSVEETEKKLDRVYEKARRQENGGPFRPEMINRIEELGGFITFVPLSQDVVAQIAERQIKKINERINNDDGMGLHNVTLEVTPETMKALSKEGYNPAMGARPMRKVVREKIANQLGKWLLGHKQEVQDFVAKNGAAKLVIDSIDEFNPKIVKVKTEVSNDNVPAAPKKKAAANTPSP